ncbi:helix-turn-helix domain-containing protein [uncultured Duncaniella sp.]|jgi:hypothetical protein|uniref:helix-turn-helix domain-containing protein n=1 Tax=uncultured Duncaniella sp. TaxID=2768039 RepID=UPI000FFF0D86|nr:helix-turn-helix domain-containing protein [uncultured Duncaniella sp.]RXE74840.1 helix-turn-helix domain-containing protein [Muribaculaceae bacterium Isolate-013 (NCI)]
MTAKEPMVVLTAKYSIKETCELLQIHRDSLYKYTHNTCEIKCGWHRRGGRAVKYYLGSEILKFWNKQI